MSDRFDLVVVGAGFAGLVCARVAAERGLSVAVIERKQEPGLQLHTTGIVVKEAAEELQIPRQFTRAVPGIRLYTPRLRQIDLESPGYYFLATDTAGVLRWLSGEAERAGASLIYGVAFESARLEAGGIILDSPALHARYLVGADGARSAVARCFGLGVNRRMLVGVESEYVGVADIDPDRLHCFLDTDLSPGYLGWAVPGVGVTQIGLAGRLGAKPSADGLAEKLASVFDFSRARLVERRSGPIPVGGRVQPVATENVLLLGDAAGLVSPLTAGGIHPAFRYGRRAGELIAAHLRHGGPDPGSILAREYPGYRWKSLLRHALDCDPPNWLYDWTLGLPPMRALAQLIYFHHEGLKSRAGWRALLRGR
ncbi:MAG: NAD(P)/FAD-dependent oxidoreductase [Rhodospirillales bacterium]|nr:MAG: NAD(P)/FAD-dependent oxidoreductase [Rhodospirillales bacterium]